MRAEEFSDGLVMYGVECTSSCRDGVSEGYAGFDPIQKRGWKPGRETQCDCRLEQGPLRHLRGAAFVRRSTMADKLKATRPVFCYRTTIYDLATPCVSKIPSPN